MMNRFWRLLEQISEVMKFIGAACLVIMMLLTCADVVGRYFRHPIFGSVEIVGFLATLTVTMALPYTHQVGGHIGVEILVRMLSPKTQVMIDIVTGILSFCLFGLVAWRLGVYALTMQRSGEVSMNLEFPEYLVIYIVMFCFTIFFLLILQNIIQQIQKLRGAP